jgi:hypothetical protein
MRASLQSLLDLQWQVSLPATPWVTLQRTGPVFDLRGHDTQAAALAYCREWSFVSRILLQPDAARPVYPVGDGGVVLQGWDWDWLALWLRMDDLQFEALVSQERLATLCAGRLTLARLQTDCQLLQTRA